MVTSLCGFAASKINDRRFAYGCATRGTPHPNLLRRAGAVFEKFVIRNCMSTPNSIIPIITNIMIITIVEGSMFSFDVVGAAVVGAPVVGTLVGAAVVGADVVGTLVGAAVSPKFSTFIGFAVSTRANEVCARTEFGVEGAFGSFAVYKENCDPAS